MKHLSLLLLFLFLCTTAISQVNYQVTYQPNAQEGKDADVFSADEWKDLNFGASPWLRAESWTRFSSPNLVHGLIWFPIKEILSQASAVTKIELTLYKDHDYTESNGGSWGDNDSRLYLLTEDWDENTVTWNSQPDYDNASYVEIPMSNDYDSVQLDVTAMIQNCIDNDLSFYGFMIRNNVEVEYRSLNFTSSDGEIAARRPKISISYTTESQQCSWEKINSTLSFRGGDVAIGTLSANGYKLSVDGTIFSKEMIVNPDGWPDYVFEPGHSLMSLPELEKYITVQGHLPKVPSRQEVLTDGIKLAEMNKVLLEKIEELTLYLLQHNMKIEELEKAIISKK